MGRSYAASAFLSAKLSYNGEEIDLCLCPTKAHFSEELIEGKKTRILTLDPVDIEFNGVSLKLQTKEYFEEGSSNIKIERNILEISDPTAEIYLDEYITACYGTTEYPEDMTGIILKVEGPQEHTIDYEYRCRDAKAEGATEVSATIQAIQTKVSLTPSAEATGYIEEGYAFSPMFKLGYKKKISDKEVFATWLNLEKAN